MTPEQALIELSRHARAVEEIAYGLIGTINGLKHKNAELEAKIQQVKPPDPK